MQRETYTPGKDYSSSSFWGRGGGELKQKADLHICKGEICSLQRSLGLAAFSPPLYISRWFQCSAVRKALMALSRTSHSVDRRKTTRVQVEQMLYNIKWLIDLSLTPIPSNADRQSLVSCPDCWPTIFPDVPVLPMHLSSSCVHWCSNAESLANIPNQFLQYEKVCTDPTPPNRCLGGLKCLSVIQGTVYLIHIQALPMSTLVPNSWSRIWPMETRS